MREWEKFCCMAMMWLLLPKMQYVMSISSSSSSTITGSSSNKGSNSSSSRSKTSSSFGSIPSSYSPPIPRWQESWTASQAHGTTIAMTHMDCLIIFLRSPKSDVYKASGPSSPLTQTSFDGLHVEQINRETQFIQYGPSWLPLGSDTVCCMTGLALDVEHIFRRIQKISDDYYNLFKKFMTSHTITQRLATILQQECLYKSSRPYGIQSMILGCDDIDIDIGMDTGTDTDTDINDSNSNNNNDSTSLCIYSIDPSGSWQNWGKAAAIGKYGMEVRRTIGNKLVAIQNNNKKENKKNSNNKILANNNSTSFEDTIVFLIECWKETCQHMGTEYDILNEEYDFIILQRPQNHHLSTNDDNNKIMRRRRKSSGNLFRVATYEVDRIIKECMEKGKE